ncbi:MAG TPA: YcxB family protein [Bacteroidia bacterium]|nr:YcxB family protein [Bacteroidia bacterium]
MILKTQISINEYLKLLYGLIYRKPIMILILFVDLIMIVWITSYYLNLFPFPEPSVYQFITLILISVVQPAVIFSTVRRNYKSSNHLNEELEIEISRNEIKLHGESFFTEIKWIKIFKVVEYKNWFLIYENTFSAIVIPKKVFNPDNLREFTGILKGLKNVPIDMKGTS